MENIIENINNSSLTNSQKNKLLEYANKLWDKQVPILFDLEQVKLLFGIEHMLQEFMDKSTSFFTIEKYSGGNREIHVPNLHLKEIQRWIIEKILYKCKISDYTCGYVKGKSILNHAKSHIHKSPSWLITYDITDFFPSINIISVKKIFLEIGYNIEVADSLANLCSFKGKLVQGFPTSPILSNIYFEEIDSLIKEFCILKKINYSRYADDMAFSGEGEYLPKELEIELTNFIEGTLKKYGFILNKSKTKIYTSNKVKKITGIIIYNNHLRVPSKLKRFLSKEIYYCKKFGVEDHLIVTRRIGLANYKGYLYGLAGYIRMVEPEIGNQFFEELKNIYWG